MAKQDDIIGFFSKKNHLWLSPFRWFFSRPAEYGLHHLTFNPWKAHH
jgi:hypothetical protein